jgi:hypothetical protein
MSSFTIEDILEEAATSRASRDDMVLNTDVAAVLDAVNSPSGSSLRQSLLGGRARSRSPRGPSSGSGRPSLVGPRSGDRGPPLAPGSQPAEVLQHHGDLEVPRRPSFVEPAAMLRGSAEACGRSSG